MRYLLDEDFAARILPITTDVAEEWGRLNAKRPLPAVDSLLAATANAHGLILATRNVGDLRDVGARVVNPFEFALSRFLCLAWVNTECRSGNTGLERRTGG